MQEVSITDKNLVGQVAEVGEKLGLPLIQAVLGGIVGLFLLYRAYKAIQHISNHGTQSFRGFVIALILTFAAPLVILIIIPALRQQHIHGVAYDKERDGVEGFYPTNVAKSGLGEATYAREGCVQCHTQMIRPAQIALDAWRQGAGENQDARSATPVRSNTLRDYLGEQYAFLGVQRNGPDLTNAGYKFADKRSELHLHFYAPKQLNEWSNAPRYTNLYEVRPIQGPGSSKALALTGKFAAPRGYEVVPTAEAEQLADYILSLKRDALIPGTSVAAAPDKAKK